MVPKTWNKFWEKAGDHKYTHWTIYFNVCRCYILHFDVMCLIMYLNVLKLRLCFSNCTIFEFHSFVVLFQLFKYKSFCYKSKVNTTSAFHNTTPQLKYHAILWGIQSLIRNTYTWLFWTWCLYGARKIPIRGTNTQGSTIFHKKRISIQCILFTFKADA